MSIPSLGRVDINDISYNTSTNRLTWTVGEGEIHAVKRERIVAVVPCPEDSKLMSYIWLDDSPSTSLTVPDNNPGYELKRFEAAAAGCPASLRPFMG
ncbi:hypothetical protein ACJ72_06915, partial [Emergomyces africanus]